MKQKPDKSFIVDEFSASAPSFAARLKTLRRRRGWTQTDLANALEISKSHVAQLETARTKASNKLVHKVARMEAATAPFERSDIMREPQVVTLRQIPVLSAAQMGALTSYEELPDDFQSTYPTDIDDPKAFALQLRGDSMEPRFKEGDIAVLRPSSEPRQQDTVVARLHDGSVVCKIYTREKNQVVLRSLNPVYEPIRVDVAEISWIYPVDSVVKILWK